MRKRTIQVNEGATRVQEVAALMTKLGVPIRGAKGGGARCCRPSGPTPTGAAEEDCKWYLQRLGLGPRERWLSNNGYKNQGHANTKLAPAHHLANDTTTMDAEHPALLARRCAAYIMPWQTDFLRHRGILQHIYSSKVLWDGM